MREENPILTRRLMVRMAALEREGLRRSLPRLEGRGVLQSVSGRPALNFCGNDYLGLATDPRVIEAAEAAARRFGAGGGSARLVSGEYTLLEALESALAEWVGAPSCLLFGSGYLANLAVLSTLPARGDTLLSDALNHASIIDGARLSRAQTVVLPHADVGALQGSLATAEGMSWYVTESIFSMDGDIAPLGELLSAVTQAQGASIVDEAHAVGVAGEDGRGVTFALRRMGRAPDVVVGTLGKALGSYGAFVAGSTLLREVLLNTARPFIFTTAPPPAAVGAALEALKIVREEPDHREALSRAIRRVHEGLGALGLPCGGALTPIVPVVVGPADKAVELAGLMLEGGIFARAIRPPTVPPGTSRLRLTLSAQHTPQHIDRLLEVLEQGCRALRLGRFGEV